MVGLRPTTTQENKMALERTIRDKVKSILRNIDTGGGIFDGNTELEFESTNGCDQLIVRDTANERFYRIDITDCEITEVKPYTVTSTRYR